MKESSLFSNICNIPYGHTKKFKLFDVTKNSKDFVQKLQLQRKIPVHAGCVNSICWNETGNYILSGSDDQRLAVVNGYDYSVTAYIDTGHRANIFSAKFLPCSDDIHVVSCSGDGIIIYSDLNQPSTSLDNKFICHRGTAYEIMTIPNDPNTFLSCGEDRTVRWFDVRTKTSCSKEDCKDDVLINCQAPVTSLAVNPLIPYQLAVGSADASVRIFDRRMLSTQSTGLRASNGFQALMTCFTVPEFEHSRRITSLCYSSDGHEMLVSYSSDYIYLFDVKDDLEKEPKLLSKEGPSSSAESDHDSILCFRGRPLMKRLRIRGDWSDTGPNARPESEAREVPPETASRNSIVRTMTDILTRMFNSPGQNSTRSEASRSTPASSDSSSSENIDVAETSEEDRVIEERSTQQEVANEGSQAMEIEVSEGNTNHISNTGVDSNIENQNVELSQHNIEPNEEISDNVPSITCSAFEDEGASSNVIEEPKQECNKEKIHDVCEKDLKKNRDNDEKITNDNSPSCSSNRDCSYEDIEESLESKRNELIEKHHSEPMVNLHYSGQSVSSGLITMDVANSSTPNERQWMEQTASDLSELPYPEVSSQTQASRSWYQSQSQHASSDSETETAIQTIRPNPNLPLSGRPLDDRPLTFTERADAAEDELELMVEVDSCSWDSEPGEENRRLSRGSPSQRNRRTRCDRHTDDFMCSLNEKVKAANNEMKKEDVTMQNVSQPRVKRKYTGHRNARTMIKESTFWGDNFIMSGSDCGHIFVWDRFTSELVMLMEADHHVVNCLQPHPFDPILASSGIDYDIKLWAPTRDEPFFDVEKANEIIKRNEVMLEETKDTITVPASFMFRMFTSLSNFRTGRAYRWSRAAREMRAARERDNQDSSRR